MGKPGPIRQSNTIKTTRRKRLDPELICVQKYQFAEG